MQQVKTATLAFFAEVLRVVRGPGQGVSKLQFWRWVSQAFWLVLILLGIALAVAAQGSWSWQYVPLIGITGAVVVVFAMAAQVRLSIVRRDAEAS